MTSIVTGTFTSDGNARILPFGSTVLYFEMHNLTQYASVANPGVLKRAWYESNMADGTYVGVKNTNAAATDESVTAAANGFTAINQGAKFGLTISGFTNANPGVITVSSDPAAYGVLAGDTIVIGNLVDVYNASKTTLNGSFTVASTTSTTIVLVEDTTNYRVYSQGGIAYISDEPTENVGVVGLQLGSAVCGANNDVWHYKAILAN